MTKKTEAITLKKITISVRDRVLDHTTLKNEIEEFFVNMGVNDFDLDIVEIPGDFKEPKIVDVSELGKVKIPNQLKEVE